MIPIKIGIVEDELIIARDIIAVIEELGYNQCGPAISYTEAVQLLENDRPDLVLLDISLSGMKDGIDVAGWINENHPIPFIFLTSYSDTQTLDRAKKVKPHAYIVKPFTGKELFASIEIAFSNFTGIEKPLKEDQPIIFNTPDALFVKEEKRFHKVYFNDILYVESGHNYIALFLAGMRKFIIRTGMREFLEKLPASIFLQVHRSFIINLNHVEIFDQAEVVVRGQKIPVGKTHHEELMKRLGIE